MPEMFQIFVISFWAYTDYVENLLKENKHSEIVDYETWLTTSEEGKVFKGTKEVDMAEMLVTTMTINFLKDKYEQLKAEYKGGEIIESALSADIQDED